ncbi:MAG TPA: hypothetical protein VGR55_16740 [Candidatus Acidoferrum sp.]|nr:hypothetical protein [Candidatus Acidoferrum sp.]
MNLSPVLFIHICGGTLGLFSGAAALSFRKGSAWHVLAGKIFVASMLVMAAGAAYLGVTKHQPNNVGGGIFTFYLILTAWFTARHADGETSKLDWVALLIPLTLGILTWINGVSVVRSGASSQAGVPVGMIFFMGSIELLAATGDIRMLVHRGVLGASRIRRHLWRMCFGLFIATGSFFLGPANRPLRLLASVGFRQQILRDLFRQEVLLFLAVLPLLLLIFWLIRVRFRNAYVGNSMSSGSKVGSLPT